MQFRSLRPEEVECRVGTVKENKGISLLLYKDARCDMNILDETVGPMNWQREHVLIDGQLFCRVGIREEHENYSTGFTWKEDVGTESYTEAEKGRASDAFKRACFNWGIGRELYSAPFIWIQGAGKSDKFYVKEMEVEDRKITRLTICSCDQYGRRLDDVAFEWPKTAKASKAEKAKEEQTEDSEDRQITEQSWNSLKAKLKELGLTQKAFLSHYGLEKPSEITMKTYRQMLLNLKRLEDDRSEQ